MNRIYFLAILSLAMLATTGISAQENAMPTSPIEESFAQYINNTSDEFPTSSTSVAGYTTSVGFRGGFTNGITLKHFVSSTAAFEFIAGSRYYGYSFTALYEIHKANALQVQNLTWNYGIGARVGRYGGRSYYRGRNCNNSNDKWCSGYYGSNDYLTALGIVAILGLEYRFEEIPFTLSLDLMPHVYLNHYRGGHYIDGSIALRYILK